MRPKTKKSLSLFLTLAMVFTMLPAITLTFTEKAHAYGTYSKPYATEYYYASGQTFIEALCVGYDSSSASTVKNQMTGAGWTPVSNFLDMMQSWSGSKNIYVGYKTTTNPANALTDIEFYDSDDAHTNYDWHGKNSGWANKNTGTDTCNGTSATGVKDKNTGIVFFRAGGSPMTAYSKDGIVDFLMGMGSGYGYEYLCATKNRSAGAAITAVDCFSGASSGWTMATCLARGCTAHSSAHGHSTRYVGYQRLTATVNSATLRSNYTTALGRYNESNYAAKYTAASRTALQNALSTAEGILSDLNDGYTTSNQTAINNAATALSNAVSGLTLNTYTVTFKGYTSGTTVGTLKTQTVSYGGSAAAPTAATTYDGSNHYTFKSWTGDAYTNVTSARTVTATYNTVAHSYTSTVTNPATCTAAGSTKYTCGCGYTYTSNTVPAALNHDFSSKTTTAAYLKSAATCTAKAVYYYKCSRCDAKSTNTYEYGNALGHDYSGDYVNQSSGKHYRKCARFAACGAYGIGTAQNATENCSGGAATCTASAVCAKCSAAYGSSLGHSWNYAGATFNWNGYACATATVKCSRDASHALSLNTTVTSAVTAPATCAAAGTRTYTASFAQGGTTYTDIKTETIPATGAHAWEWVTDTAPTCGAAGVKHEECSVCHARQNENTAIPATGSHTEQAIPAVPATCLNAGSTAGVKCSVCGTVLTAPETVEALGHNFDDAIAANVNVVAATCTKAGTKTVKCSRCDETETTVIEATGHTPGEAVRENETAATCTAEGSYDEVVYCTVCETELSRETKAIEKKAHTPGEAVRENETAATCTAEGSYDEVVYCTVCETELSRETKTIEKKAHTPGEAVRENETAATCAAEGSYDEVVYCTVCETELSRETKAIEKEAHTPGEAVRENETAATCTAEGSYDEVIYCTVCETELSRETKAIEKKAHTPGEAVRENENAATCTAEGRYDEVVYCTVCETELSRATKAIDKKAHTPGEAVRENETAATCTAEGSYDEVVYCTVCETELSRETKAIEKKAHTPGEAVRENETAATCTAEGSYDEVVYCAVCETELSRETRTIEKKAHTPGEAARENETAATCTAEGSYDEVIYCTVCETELSRETKAIEKEAHTPGEAVRENETAATCTAEGSYDEVVYCTVCETELSRETKAIEKKAHTPGEAVRENENAATCTAEGRYDEVVYCTVCETELSRATKAIDKKAHTPGEAVRENETAATCTAEGSYDEVVYCTVCETELSRETKAIEKKAHTPGEAVRENETAATCTAEGSYDEVVYCAVCETELSRETRTIEKKAHTPGEAARENETAATCTAEGSYDEVIYCTVCETELSRETKAIEKEAHTPGEAVRENETAATCTAEGSYDEVVYCTVCETELSRETKTIEKKAHTPGEAVRENETAATCAAEGSYDEVVYCTVCETELSRETKNLPVVDHSFTARIPSEEYRNTAATCTEKATYFFACSACGAMGTETYEYGETAPHATHHVAAKEAGCPIHAARMSAPRRTGSPVAVTGFDGNVEYWYCENCGLYFAEEEAVTVLTAAEIVIPAAHRMTHVEGVPATHYADGSREYWYCEICESYFLSEAADEPLTEEELAEEAVIPSATTHIPGEPVFENDTATCTEDGTRDRVVCCAECGIEMSRSTEASPAKGHAWGEWETVTPATEAADGEARRVCAVCGAEETKAISATGEEVAKLIKFVNIAKMHYLIDMGDGETYVVYNSSTVQWISNQPMKFKVVTYAGFNFEDVIVYADGKALTPDGDGYYTLPKTDETVTVTVAGAVKDDTAPGGKLSFWELLLRFFRRIAAFFSNVFGKSARG